jgi:DNA-binding NtrC family response regulator
MPPKIAFFDDDRTQLRLYDLLLERSLFAAQIEWVLIDNISAAKQALRKNSFSLVFLDLNFGSNSEAGFDVLRFAKELPSSPEVIIASAQANFANAKKAMQLGADDFIQKATAALEIPLQIERHLKFKQEKFESQAWRNTYNRDLEKYRIIGESKFSKTLLSQIEKLAPNDISILIEGETGVGKELVARNIHLRSNRAMGPFVAIDCGAVPETLAESTFLVMKREHLHPLKPVRKVYFFRPMPERYF